MKIVLNTFKDNILTKFISLGKKQNIEIIGTKSEKDLFSEISKENKVDGFILSNHFDYTQKAVDFIRKKMPQVPIIVYTTRYNKIKMVDIQMPEHFEFLQLEFDKSPEDLLFDITIQNLQSFISTFNRLQKIIVKAAEPISFGKCNYDPIRRILLHNGELVKKLTGKEGGILEILGANYGTVVNKDLILERVWQKSDYFSSRSMDVYITNLRNLLKKHNIDLTIANITGSGLILE